MGIASPVAAYRIPHLLGADNMGAILALALFVFLLGAAWASWLSSASLWTVGLLFYVGLPIGTLVDVIIDSSSRNLFPFEVILWLIVGVIPVALGVMWGRSLREEFVK